MNLEARVMAGTARRSDLERSVWFTDRPRLAATTAAYGVEIVGPPPGVAR